MNRLPAVLAVLLAAAALPWARAASAQDFTPCRMGKIGPEDNLLQRRDGALHITGGGRESYAGRDEGTFVGFASDKTAFRFTARLVGFDGGGANPKVGISLREGLTGIERAVHLRYDAFERNQCLQWFLRHHIAPDPHDGGGRAHTDGLIADARKRQNVWMRIDRRYPFALLSWSEDGEKFHEVPHAAVLLERKLHIGFSVTGGGNGATPATAIFDQVRFEELPDTAAGPAPVDPPVPDQPWLMYAVNVATVHERKPTEATVFLMMPKGLDPRELRGLLWSAGSKELTVAGKPMKFTSGAGLVRIPEGVEKLPATLELKGMEALYPILAHYKLARVGGAFPPPLFEKGMAALAEYTGIAHLPRLPFMATGYSFAGGFSIQGARLYPDRCAASAPAIISGGTFQEKDPLHAIPMMYLYGSHDSGGAHMKEAAASAARIRAADAPWANAPMWMVYHRAHRSAALIYPWFIDVLELRVPAGADFTAGPVPLLPLDTRKGYVGLMDTWQSNDPTIMPIADYKGDSGNLVWLPTERSAIAWRAFVSNKPSTVIHYPRFDGTSTFGGAQPYDWQWTTLRADQPFTLIASGPTGQGVRTRFYADTRELTVLKEHGHPLHITAAGLPAGLHVLYARTTFADGRQEISRPSSIMFVP